MAACPGERQRHVAEVALGPRVEPRRVEVAASAAQSGVLGQCRPDAHRRGRGGTTVHGLLLVLVLVHLHMPAPPPQGSEHARAELALDRALLLLLVTDGAQGRPGW
jgi:hypothetical protein